MAIRNFAHTHEGAGGDALAIPTVAAMIAVLFAGSTVLTPLYIVYKQQFGFSQITLTLIYAVYVVGNLAALVMFGGVSDVVGRRPASLAAMLVAIVSALVFLFAGNVVSLDVARILSGLGIGVGSASARGPELRGLPSFFPARTSRAPV
ncbi:MFS transporter [Mesorhizobium sp. L2C084A000]|uniref:MFS transporter n=1 Tax=Mesorhizobium sp. L2C084A000 TaxID=1287116 RepID=UPI001FD8CE7C|nr:MFS transporter [Mesorhizobium sp. L2C084A000]